MKARRGAPRTLLTASAAFLTAATVAGCTAAPGELVPGVSGSDEDAAEATVAEEPLRLPGLGEQPLDPGRYVAVVDGPGEHPILPVLTVPDGFEGIGGNGVVDWGGDNFPLEGRVVWVWDIDAVYTHPCAEGGKPAPVGPTVADLANALAAQPLRDAPPPEPVTIGGYDGLHVRLSVPVGTDVDACPGGRFNSWPGRWQQVGGQIDMLWILDVEGDRIAIAAAHGPDESQESVDELTEIVTTATFAREKTT